MLFDHPGPHAHVYLGMVACPTCGRWKRFQLERGDWEDRDHAIERETGFVWTQFEYQVGADGSETVPIEGHLCPLCVRLHAADPER